MNCSKANGCRHYLTGIGCMVCENENNFKPLRETNADRIRAMSDEELADEILRWFNWLNAVEWDDKRIIDWLKQEVINDC